LPVGRYLSKVFDAFHAAKTAWLAPFVSIMPHFGSHDVAFPGESFGNRWFKASNPGGMDGPRHTES
jgi:hypothetical protein